MPWLFAVLGGVVGASFYDLRDALPFAVMGFLLGSLLELRSRIERLEDRTIRFAPDRAEREPAPPREPPAEPRTAAPPVTPARVAPREPRFVPPPRTTIRHPDAFDRFAAWAAGHLTGPGLMVTAGIIVLFFGVAFLVKLAVERGLVPIELRLASAALSGVALLILGWRTREGRPIFGLSLQGGGLGILYLTVFAALRLYALVPAGMAFLLLVALAVLSAFLSIAQDSRSLAALGATGGFLAPLLASTGQGSHVALFSYYLVLNAGILAVSWFRSWRVLNLLGFFFTFFISAIWGARYYVPEYFPSVEPFLVLFFLMYVAIAVLFALRQAPELRGLVDGTLVFGVPLAAALLQSALVKDFEYGLAWSALVLGVFYAALAGALFRFRGKELKDLSEAFLATGVVFATLAVPLAFEGLVTSALWALEGSAIVWIGVRQRRALARAFGCVLQGFAGLVFLFDHGPAGERAVWNAPFLGASILSFAGWVTSLQLHRGGKAALGRVFFGWALVWWLGAGLHEIFSFAESVPGEVAWMLFFFTLSAAASDRLSRLLSWPELRAVALGFLPALSLPLARCAFSLEHPFEGLAAAGWAAALLAHLWLLRVREGEDVLPLPSSWHPGGLWLATILMSWETSFRAGEALGPGTWSDLMWGLVPAVLLAVLASFGEKLSWPLRAHLDRYVALGGSLIALYLLLWSLHTLGGGPWDPAPLGYLPLLNPIDVTVIAAFTALVLWHARASRWLGSLGIPESAFQAILGGAAFLWLHGVVFRTAHFWAGVPYELDALHEATGVQTAVAVLWAAVGLGSMVAGTARGARELWILGAALMGAVVLKLFLVDLQHTGTVARIVSFLGVGALLLVVGYFSPVPPQRGRAEASSS